VATSHLGRGSGLIDEHETLGVEVQLAVEPGLTAVQDVGAALLVRVRRLFLSVIRRPPNNRHTLDTLVPTPCWAKASRSSARVMSSLASTRPRISSA
jgi:hypothetical protein